MRGLIISAIALAAILGNAAQTQARERAPLPEGMRPSGLAPVNGLYAELKGSYGDGLRFELGEIDKVRTDCLARGKSFSVQRDDQSPTEMKAHLYRTREQYAVVLTHLGFDIDKEACIARAVVKYDIESHRLVHARIFTFEPARRDAAGPQSSSWSPIEGPAGAAPLDWPGYPFEHGFNTGVRDGCQREIVCKPRRVLGLRAVCWTLSLTEHGAVGQCASIERGPSYGLHLSTSDADRTAESTLSKLIPDAAIDPAIFDLALSTLAPAQAAARDSAPLPPGIEASPLPLVPGAYVEVVSWSKAHAERYTQLDAANARCEARRQVFRTTGAASPQVVRSQVYRTRDRYILVASRLDWEIDEAGCSATVAVRRTVESHRLIDGRLHEYRAADDERTSVTPTWKPIPSINGGRGLDWPSIGQSGALGLSNGQVDCHRKVCRSRRLDRLRVVCWTESGEHDGYDLCMSVQKDGSEGMLFSQDFGEPILADSGSDLVALIPAAMIDPAVFDLAR